MLQATVNRHGDCIYQSAYQNGRMDPIEDADLSTIGGRIVYCRKLRGLSGAELARRAKCAQPTLWALERNETKEVTAWLLDAVARALEVTFEFLLHGPDATRSIETSVAEAEVIALFRGLGSPARFSLLEFARHLKGSSTADLSILTTHSIGKLSPPQEQAGKRTRKPPR